MESVRTERGPQQNRGMTSEDNLEFLPKRVTEAFILCRIHDRKEKDIEAIQRVRRHAGLREDSSASHLFDVKVLMKDKKFALIDCHHGLT